MLIHLFEYVDERREIQKPNEIKVFKQPETSRLEENESQRNLTIKPYSFGELPKFKKEDNEK